MKVRKPADIPKEKQEERRRAVWLQWMDLGFRLSIVAALAAVLGSSQAMQAAFLDDVFGLTAPIGWLIADQIQKRPPTDNFPFGFYRSVNIAFLSSALALIGLGLYLVYESVSGLIEGTHPTIGVVELFGTQIWLGWLMIAALTYSAIPGFVIGRMLVPVAKNLHDKALFANSRLAKAEWMTALAAIVGIIGIGFGYWWADAVAALVIAVDVLRDGVTNVWAAVKDLMDEVPRTVEKGELDCVMDRVREKLESLPWVEEAEVALREEGHLLTGVAYVVARDPDRLVDRLEDAVEEVEALDWRLHDISIMPVADLR